MKAQGLVGKVGCGGDETNRECREEPRLAMDAGPQESSAGRVDGAARTQERGVDFEGAVRKTVIRPHELLAFMRRYPLQPLTNPGFRRSAVTPFIRWDEKAGLQRHSIRSQ